MTQTKRQKITLQHRLQRRNLRMSYLKNQIVLKIRMSKPINVWVLKSKIRMMNLYQAPISSNKNSNKNYIRNLIAAHLYTPMIKNWSIEALVWRIGSQSIRVLLCFELIEFSILDNQEIQFEVQINSFSKIGKQNASNILPQ